MNQTERGAMYKWFRYDKNAWKDKMNSKRRNLYVRNPHDTLKNLNRRANGLGEEYMEDLGESRIYMENAIEKNWSCTNS